LVVTALAVLAAVGTCWWFHKCVAISLDEPTLVQQMKRVWAAPVIRVRVK
jgi:hypothetical protein